MNVWKKRMHHFNTTPKNVLSQPLRVWGRRPTWDKTVPRYFHGSKYSTILRPTTMLTNISTAMQLKRGGGKLKAHLIYFKHTGRPRKIIHVCYYIQYNVYHFNILYYHINNWTEQETTFSSINTMHNIWDRLGPTLGGPSCPTCSLCKRGRYLEKVGLSLHNCLDAGQMICK